MRDIKPTVSFRPLLISILQSAEVMEHASFIWTFEPKSISILWRQTWEQVHSKWWVLWVWVGYSTIKSGYKKFAECMHRSSSQSREFETLNSKRINEAWRIWVIELLWIFNFYFQRKNTDFEIIRAKIQFWSVRPSMMQSFGILLWKSFTTKVIFLKKDWCERNLVNADVMTVMSGSYYKYKIC